MGKVDAMNEKHLSDIRSGNAQGLMEAYQAKAQGGVLGGAGTIAQSRQAPDHKPDIMLSEVIDELDGNISHLQERLNFLTERLTPVTRQVTEPSIRSGPREHDASILNIVEQQSFRIRCLTEQVQGIVERLVL